MRTMTRAAAAVAISSVFLGFGRDLPGVAAQSPAVLVSVTPTSGQGLAALQSNDFTVDVDGSSRAITSVARQEAPSTFLLIVDVSLSAMWRFQLLELGLPSGDGPPPSLFPGFVNGLKRGLIDTMPAGDRLRIGRTGGLTPLTVSHAFDDDHERALEAIRQVLYLAPNKLTEYYAPSPIWDAVVAGTTLLSHEPDPRAILLVTDGEASGNRNGVSDAARYAAAHGVRVHVMFNRFVFMGGYVANYNSDQNLRRLAEETGGAFLLDDRMDQGGWRAPIPKFGDAIAMMHRMYTLQVAIDDLAPGVHRLDVRTRRPGVQVSAPKWLVVGEAPLAPEAEDAASVSLAR